MPYLSLNELKLIAKSRDIKGYKSMSEERLLSALNASKLVKESQKNFDNIESRRNEDNIIKDIRNLFKLEKKTIPLKIKYLETQEPSLNYMKMIIINQ